MPSVPRYIVEGAGRLKYRNTILVYLKVESENLFPDNWLYVHSPHLKLGRITNFRNWVNTLYGNQKSTIVALEYWCYPHDEIWMSDDKDLEALGVKELHETGLTGASKITGAYVHRISKSYPVYSKGYKNDLNRIEIYLGKISKLHVIGRNGSFKYNNQDHSLLMGILAAENILDNMSHDLWAVNTDYDNYQEKSAISDTGLQIF
jgi:protoporphyrinogen oxidase